LLFGIPEHVARKLAQGIGGMGKPVLNGVEGAGCKRRNGVHILEIQQTGFEEGAIIATSIYYFVTMHPEDHEDELDLPPSKTKIKQQMHNLQDIGEQLVELGNDRLKELNLPERLYDAIREMKRINKFGAQRRQMQFIGRLMREVETAPIIAKLEVWGGTSRLRIEIELNYSIHY